MSSQTAELNAPNSPAAPTGVVCSDLLDDGKFMKTFKCKFGKDLTCEMQVTDTAPPKGSQHIHKIEWDGKPSPRVLRPYIAWINSVNKTLADEWGVKLMHVFQTKPSWADAEIWVYEPHKQPKRVVV